MRRHLALLLGGLLLAALAQAGPLRVVAISDLNGSYGATDYHAAVDRAVDRILALQPDLVISAGDMVAGQRRPHLSEAQVEAMWQGFHQHVSDRLAAAGIPFAVTPGNHDASAYHGFERERAIFAAQWQARKPALSFLDERNYPWYYAFSLGETLFISLDVTRVGALDGQQKQWLRAMLAAHGPRYRQRIVYSHLPLWPLAQGRESEYSGDVELETLLRDAAVDLYISGHQHAFYPGHKDGLNLLGLACLGAAPRRLIGDSGGSPRSFALLEIDDGGLRLAALQPPDFSRSVPWRSLPAQIATAVARLQRADLAQQRFAEWSLQPAVEPPSTDARPEDH